MSGVRSKAEGDDPQPQHLIVEKVGTQTQHFRIFLTTPEGIPKDLTTVDDRTTRCFDWSEYAFCPKLPNKTSDLLNPTAIRLWKEYVKDDDLRDHSEGVYYAGVLEKFSRENPGMPEAEVETTLGRIGRNLKNGERKLRNLMLKGLRRRVHPLSKRC